MQQYAVVVGSTAKQADFRGHELGPFGDLEWVNRITRANELARPSVSALLAVYYFMVVCRNVDRRRRPAEFLRPAAGCRGPSLHWARHSLIVWRHRRSARARYRLCDTLPRIVSRGGGALSRVHAGEAERGEMVNHTPGAVRARLRRRSSTRRFRCRSRDAGARAGNDERSRGTKIGRAHV